MTVVYSVTQRKIYLSPGRLAIMHFYAHHGLVVDDCYVCKLGRGEITWDSFCQWIESQGFLIVKRGPSYIALHVAGRSFKRCGWIRTAGEVERLFKLLFGDAPGSVLVSALPIVSDGARATAQA